MEESLEIPVTYRGEELSFPCQLLSKGYTHQIEVEVYGQSVLFEPDEEKNYRAILPQESQPGNPKIDIALLKAIAEVIESVVK